MWPKVKTGIWDVPLLGCSLMIAGSDLKWQKQQLKRSASGERESESERKSWLQPKLMQMGYELSSYMLRPLNATQNWCEHYHLDEAFLLWFSCQCSGDTSTTPVPDIAVEREAQV